MKIKLVAILTRPYLRVTILERWKSPVTSYSPGEVEVCEWQTQGADGTAVVEVVEKWESRVVCGISKPASSSSRCFLSRKLRPIFAFGAWLSIAGRIRAQGRKSGRISRRNDRYTAVLEQPEKPFGIPTSLSSWPKAPRKPPEARCPSPCGTGRRHRASR